MKRVLVLRAREDAGHTAEKLRAMGFEPLVSPVLEIVATGAAIPEGPFDAVLATSAQGVKHLAPAHALPAAPLHAVGARTAKAAEKLGWRTYLVAGNSASLLALIQARYRAPAKFLYLAGRDRRDDLETGLRAAGHEVVTVETYTAQAASALSQEAREALSNGEVAAVLHYSGRSGKIFLQLAHDAGLTDSLRQTRHLALSKDVALPLARELGVSAHVAETPDERHLLALLAENV